MGQYFTIPKSTLVMTNQPFPTFDYYLLQMSYTPEFCKTHPDQGKSMECTGNYNLVLHGLWPQYLEPKVVNGKTYNYPEFCSTEWDNVNAADILRQIDGWQDIAPEYDKLLKHEIQKHCSCTNLDPVQYTKNAIELAKTIPNPSIKSDIAKDDAQKLFPNGEIIMDENGCF